MPVGEADGIGAALEAMYRVALTADPVSLIGLGSGGGAGEEYLPGEFDLCRTADPGMSRFCGDELKDEAA